MMTEEDITKEIMKRFSTQERTEMKLCRLDNYCLFIASRYLSSVEDEINLVKTCKRMRNNMEKYHYNPMSLTEKTILYFPNVETLHIYNRSDKYIEGGRISQYCNWLRKGWYEWKI